MRKGLQSLFVIADSSAPSFCHYETTNKEPMTMSPATLRKIAYYALTNNLSLNILVGDEPLNNEISEALKYCNYVILRNINADIANDTEHSLDIFDYESSVLNDPHGEHLILRMNRKHLSEFPQWLAENSLAYSRISLVIKDLDKATENDFAAYQEVLRKTADWLPERQEEKPLELSFLTDRLILTAPNHCDAGIKHFAVAPDGGFYLCPGFYYDGEKPFTDIDAVLQTHELPFRNRQLLRLDHAPICETCDAYHCKRCVYLNKKTTLEINTPSHQQCVFSHLERNASETLIEPLFLSDEVAMAEIDYLDPFDTLQKQVKSEHAKEEKSGEC